MKKILVTGANGQLGRCIKNAAASFPDLEFVFVSKEELDIQKIIFHTVLILQHIPMLKRQKVNLKKLLPSIPKP